MCSPIDDSAIAWVDDVDAVHVDNSGYLYNITAGAAGSHDTFLAEAYTYARFMRIGDGPDQVHLSQLGRGLLKRYGTSA